MLHIFFPRFRQLDEQGKSLFYRGCDQQSRAKLNDLGSAVMPPRGGEWESIRQVVGAHLLLHAEIYLSDRAAYLADRWKVISDWCGSADPVEMEQYRQLVLGEA